VPPARDLTGYRSGMLVAVETTAKRLCGHIVWLCQCDCGREVEATIADLTRKDKRKKRSCGCMNWRRENRSPFWKGVGEMSASHWSAIVKGAAARGHVVEVTHEDVWLLYLTQQRRCALSGVEIGFGVDRTTASLDRIDSSLGYVDGNLQWLHKDINMMKWTHGQEYFIEMCRRVTLKHLELAVAADGTGRSTTETLEMART
jgi:hypothetical protein